MSQNFLFEQIPAVVFIVDKTGLIRNQNNFAKSFIAASPEEDIPKNFFEFIEHGKELIFSVLNEADQIKFPYFTEIKFTSKNNKSFQTHVSINTFKEAENSEELFIISLFDITSHKMQAELIKESQLRFESIANSAPVMIWITDVSGLFIFVNKIWTEFTNRSIGEELGLNWIQDVHPDDVNGLMNIYQKALEEKINFAYEFRFKRSDKVYRWLMITGLPRFNEQNIFGGFIGTCIDITHQKENESYIKKINDELASANKNKDKFFSIISHDLRSPLSGIMSLLDLIVSDYESLEEDERKEILNEAAKTSKSTFTLMENLLDWSRIQTGQINYDPQKVSLNLLMNNIRDLYSQKLKEKGLSLNFEIEPEFFVFADLNMTETILRNLISNAIKFTSEFGLIMVSYDQQDQEILIKVKDTGVGMTEKQVSHLFKIEETNSTIGTAGERGTGLGLLLCKELVEKQSGKIWIESEVNKGTTFYFTLPKAK